MTMKMANGAFYPNGFTGRLTGVGRSPDVYTPNVVQVRANPNPKPKPNPNPNPNICSECDP